MRGLVVLLLDWAALLLLGALLSDFDVHGPAGALVTAVIAAALNALVWPTLSRLALPLRQCFHGLPYLFCRFGPLMRRSRVGTKVGVLLVLQRRVDFA